MVDFFQRKFNKLIYFLAGVNVAGTATVENLTVTGTTTGVTSTPADGGVTAAKLASDAVTTVKILDANVTTAKIADANVTTAKLPSAAVTGPKIASTFMIPVAIAGLDLSGMGAVATGIPVTGAQMGDAVIALWEVGTGPVSDGRAHFEATVSVNGQLKQTSLTDLSSEQMMGLLLKRT